MWCFFLHKTQQQKYIKILFLIFVVTTNMRKNINEKLLHILQIRHYVHLSLNQYYVRLIF